MKILGIDPGSFNCGYGLVRVEHSGRTRNPLSGNAVYLSSGRIVIPSYKNLNSRLRELYLSLSEMIAEYQPDEIAIERIFYAKGIKAALTLGHARGVVVLAAALTGLPLYEYSALEVKKAVVGYGRADKAQVQAMVRELLKIKGRLTPDSADALALALCHANTITLKTQIEGTKKSEVRSQK